MKQAYKPHALLILCMVSVATAHEDTPLTLSSDGAIGGIPSPFRPIRLDIDGLGTTAPKVVLRVGSRATALLPCATKHLKSLSINDVAVSGSWYHGSWTQWSLPYYVHVKFFDAWRSPYKSDHASYNFLFNMTTTALIEASREVWTDGDLHRDEKPFTPECAVADSDAPPQAKP